MSISVSLVSLLGIRSNLSGGLSYLDESDVQFVCGRNLVRYDSETRTQKIIQGTLEASGITAVAVNSGKQSICRVSAYAEYIPDKGPVITVYECATRKKRKQIVGLESGLAPVTHLAFTADSKALIVQTGAPDWTLHVVAFDRSGHFKVLAVCKSVTTANKPVTQVEGHPTDASLITLSGRGFVRFFRVVEDTLRAVQVNLRRDAVFFSSQIWLPDDKLVLGTTTGELWVLEGTEFKRVLSDSGAALVGGGRAVTALAAFPKGFIAGCEGGCVRIFEKSEDPRLYYKHTKTFTIGGDDTSRVVALSVSPNDEDLAVLCASSQAYSFKLSSYELYKPGDLAFKPLVCLFHSPPPTSTGHSMATMDLEGTGVDASAPIVAHRRGSLSAVGSAADPWNQPNFGVTGIDTCVRKPVFVTCGADKTIRIWNYAPTPGGDMVSAGATHSRAADPSLLGPSDITPTLELVQRFAEVPSCIAMHPTGLHLVVGFESNVQLMNVLMDSLKTFKEFPIRNCTDVKFSNCGGMLAAANGSVISVFNTYTCAPVTTLRAHSDRILAFTWSRDDRYIVSVGKDGMIIRYAVVVPNATSSSGAPTAGSFMPSSASGERTATNVTVGKAINSQEIRDFMPIAISPGLLDNAKEVIVSGIWNKNGVPTPILRYIDLAAPSREGPKGEIPLGGHVPRSLFALPSLRLALSGLGSSIDLRPPTIEQQAASKPGDRAKFSDSLSEPQGSHSSSFFDVARSVPDKAATLTVVGSVISTDTGGPATAPVVAASAAPAAMVDHVGVLRAYKLPLANEFTDTICHSGPILRVAATHDGKFLFTASSDGSIAVLATVDLRPRSPQAGAASSMPSSVVQDEPLPFADEILVTRADLEDVRKEKVELESRVQEIIMTNKYNERYKEMTNDEKIKEIEEKFAEELKSDRAKHDALREAKGEMEARFEEQLTEMEAAHARELEELEVTYRAKITAEMERYDALVKDRDLMNEEFDAANAALVKEQAAAIETLKRKYEVAIASEQDTAASLEDQKRIYQDDFAKTADDVEGDVDGEMEELRARYERKLQAESKATLLLQGENGFWKHKFVKANREMSEKKEDMASLGDKEKELHEAIAALQKDVQGHKKEIRERDETIADKEGRIYDLKKKNQELEKFKFVLNYKIQELKRQIMPRKREIQDMREQMKEMELELLQYHKSNAALDLMIGELKLKRDGMQREVDKLQIEIDSKDDELKKISRDVSAVNSVMRDPKALRTAVTRLYHKYIHGDSGNLAGAISKMDISSDEGAAKKGAPVGVDVVEVQKELARQRLYLERNIESLKRKMDKDEVTAKSDHARLMRENMVLTQEINELRREFRYVQADLTKLAEDVPLTATAGLTGTLDMSAIDVERAAAELGFTLGTGAEEHKVPASPLLVGDALEAHVAAATEVGRLPSAGSMRMGTTGSAAAGTTTMRRTAAKFGISSISTGIGMPVARPISGGVSKSSTLTNAATAALRARI